MPCASGSVPAQSAEDGLAMLGQGSETAHTEACAAIEVGEDLRLLPPRAGLLLSNLMRAGTFDRFGWTVSASVRTNGPGVEGRA